jgi:hypothetical protein
VHKVQAEVIRDILSYIHDKTGSWAQVSFILDSPPELQVTLRFEIPDTYPAMKKEAA